jgi:predicted ATP-grasp superfamily ATP-dependent carboligase
MAPTISTRSPDLTRRAPTRVPGPRRPRDLAVDAIVPDAHLSAAVAGIRALGWGGLHVLAVGPSWTAPGLWSKQAVARAVAPSVIGDPRGYAERLGQLAAGNGPVVMYPSREETIDVMLAHASRWSDIVLPFPDGDVLTAVRDKGQLADTVAGGGFETPASRFEASARELRGVTFEEPVVVKPTRPVSRLKTARLARDPEHLRRLLEGVPDDEQLLVQERVRGPLVSVELVLDRAGQLAARFQQRTQRTWPAAAGSIALATSVEPNDLLIARVAWMLAEIGYWGLAQVDFVETDRGFTLLDINPRFYRCLPLSIACGTNLPALWHAVAVGRNVGGPREYRVGVTYRWLEADLVAALRGSPRRLLGRAPAPHTGPTWAAGDPLPGVLLGASGMLERGLRVMGFRQRTK